MAKFREVAPRRRDNPSHQTDYKKYREELRADFGGRCGYTNCSDRWWGVKFQVDHFAPQNPKLNKSKNQAFHDLKCTYGNLVYACPQVNNAKRNYWATEDPAKPLNGDIGLLDPCDKDYNAYFQRTDAGRILPRDGNPTAEFMINRLKLYLFRYELYWRLEELYKRIGKLRSLRENEVIMAQHGDEIKDLSLKLLDEWYNYFEYIGIKQPEIV